MPLATGNTAQTLRKAPKLKQQQKIKFWHSLTSINLKLK